MKTIFKALLGSRGYGLNTSASDWDYRGVWLSTKISEIIGLSRHDLVQTQKETDEAYYELRNYLKLLRGGNPQAIELIHVLNALETSPEWLEIYKHRTKLISSEKLFQCLTGYAHSEKKTAFGESKKGMGGKRWTEIERRGFSSRNVVHAIRLLWAGSVYFTKTWFPVNVHGENPELGKHLLDIKLHPELFTAEALRAEIHTWEENLKKTFDNRAISTTFDEDIANSICLKLYKPLLEIT